MISDVVDYWNRQPCNVKHGTAPVGSLEWSKQVSERKYFVEPHIKEFAQFHRWFKCRVLEIGCGIGSDTLEFCNAGVLHIVALDISYNSIALAFNRAAELGYTNASFHCGNAENLMSESIRNEKFDLAYSFGVLHHTPYPEAVLLNMRHRLKDDGELRIMLYAKWSLKNLLGAQPEAQAGCPIARVYSNLQARKLVESCGFKVESIHKTHIFPWRLKDYVNHRYVKKWYYRIIPGPVFRWLERRLGWHLLIVAHPK